VKNLTAIITGLAICGAWLIAGIGSAGAKPPPWQKPPIIIFPQPTPFPPVYYPPVYYPPTPPVIILPPSPPLIYTPPPVIVAAPQPPVIITVSPTPDDSSVAVQTMKYVKVKNNADTKLQVFALYLGQDEKGKGVWLPAADKNGANQPMNTTLEPGQEVTLAVNDSDKVLTSRVRIWAQTDSKQWLKYQSEDLVLVDKPYKADKPDTFAMQFGK